MKNLSEIPTSVYRLQFSKTFSLKNALKILPYLNNLGIDGVYCSPLFESAGTYGYDITNPNQLDPLIGSMKDYEQFCSSLKELSMKQLLDVVPNHMGIKGNKNKWWLDVLEKGPKSPLADFFDIQWAHGNPSLRNKVVLPILQDSYEKTLKNGLIRLSWNDGFCITYADFELPVAECTYPFIFKCSTPNTLPVQKKVLLELYQKSESIRLQIKELTQHFNKNCLDHLHELLEKQFYRLSHWTVAGQEVNYRRFFNINELAAIHIEKEEVFKTHHALIFQLLNTNKIQGIRIDHPDGLYDPTEYFIRIKKANSPLIIVEKILKFKEQLPERWDVDGTEGYEFLNILNGLFVRKKKKEEFSRIYEKFIQHQIDYKFLLYQRKKLYLISNMTQETNFLGSLLDELSKKNQRYGNFTREDLTQAIKEIAANFPVYRSYIKPKEEISNTDRTHIIEAIESAKTRNAATDNSIYEFIKDLLLMRIDLLEIEKKMQINFLLRFQQLTAPIMAKGLEDSVCYIYNRLISLNEVGGDPSLFGHSVSEFHHFNQEKLTKYPLGLLASSTHDSKFSEDVRFRLNALSELPREWESLSLKWQKNNQHFKTKINNTLFPDNNTEYYIYQILIGMEGEGDPERLWQCILKALRESGVYTSWMHPSQDYEKAVQTFFFSSLKSIHDETYHDLQKKISQIGYWNSIAALVLKIGSCGIAAFYQGNELWNFCLMDPDNRKSVDFEKRISCLAHVKIHLKQITSLFSESKEELKLFITYIALKYRKGHKKLFLRGEYLPLKVHKQWEENVVAFLRRHDKQVALAVTGRFFSELISEKHPEPIGDAWGAAELQLPENCDIKVFFDTLTQREIRTQKGNILLLSEVFQFLPYALLSAEIT
ncbi:MAG: malto-oligosyltrehalose synthase [Chlamydiota bacterium]